MSHVFDIRMLLIVVLAFAVLGLVQERNRRPADFCRTHHGVVWQTHLPMQSEAHAEVGCADGTVVTWTGP